MNTLYSICTALLLLASSGANAQSTLRDKWRNSLGQCKSCGEAPYLSTLRIMDGPGCVACGGYCTRLPPLSPRDGEPMANGNAALVVADASDLAKLGLSGQDEGATRCTPDSSGIAPGGFYAIAFSVADLEMLAAQSPAAANVLVAFRDRDTMPPLKLDGGDLSSATVPTARSVMRYFATPQDGAAIQKAASQLREDEYYASTFRVEDLADGRKLLVIESSIKRSDGRLVRQVGDPFAVELIVRTGTSRPVAQISDGKAQVYDIGIYGPLSNF